MEGQNPSRPNPGDELAALIVKLLLIGAFVFFIVLLLVYLAIFALVAASLYFGVKLGTYPWWSTSTEPYHKIHELEAAKRRHLNALKGESEELQGLVDNHFEDQKHALYRPKDDTHQPPHKELAMEFGKAAMKHLAAWFFKRDL